MSSVSDALKILNVWAADRLTAIVTVGEVRERVMDADDARSEIIHTVASCHQQLSRTSHTR